MYAPSLTTDTSRAALASFLRALDHELTLELAGPGMLEEVARPLVLARESKRARPMIACLVGQALGADRTIVLDAAVAVELVHAASLLHDDVIDGADERRGLPSANARWGVTLAVLAGDMLLTNALARLRGLGASACEHAVDVVAEMTRAVASELAMRKDVDASLERWRQMAEGKTGALFGAAAWLVATAVGDHDRATRFEQALRHLGVAFQIVDDCDDLHIDASGRANETPLQDLRDGNPSFPVLVAARLSSPLRAALLEAWRTPAPCAATLAILAQRVAMSGALEVAARQVHAEIALARALLAPELSAASLVPEIAAIVGWAEALASPRRDARIAVHEGLGGAA